MSSKIIITCGDPAGVGPEIIAEWAAANDELVNDVILVGPHSWFEGSFALQAFQRVEIGPATYKAIPGQPTKEGAEVALMALEHAAEACRKGEAAGAVTGPVSKTWMQKAGFGFPGQTEFFAARWGGEAVMGFGGGKLRVVLATWHVPLSEVPLRLTPDGITRAVEAAEQLGAICDIRRPSIGVCGLNPHAGEDGLLGQEEKSWINPLLARLRERFSRLSDTLPADTLFHRALQGQFDVVVALYHDQGLGPLKTVAFDESVNITLGLPFVRTSPDHGTAFDIAGTGAASALSFTRAVELARAAIALRR